MQLLRSGRRNLRRLVPLLGIALLGCEATEPAPPQPVEIDLSVEGLDLRVGEGAVVSAAVRDAAGQPVQGVKVGWHSLDPSIARVDGEGHVQAIQPGATEIIAYAEGFSSVFRPLPVRVAPAIRRVVISDNRVEIPVTGHGCTQSVFTTAFDHTGAPMPAQSIAYSVDDTTVVHLERPRGGTAGLIAATLSGKRVGGTWLRAAWQGHLDSARVVVESIGSPARLSIASDDPVLHFRTVGDTVRLRAVVGNECGAVLEEETEGLTSRNPEIAEVLPGGRVVTRSLGTAYIDALVGTLRAGAFLIVYDFRVSPRDTTIAVGDTVVYRGEIASEPGAFRSWSATYAIADPAVAGFVGNAYGAEVRVVAREEGETEVQGGAYGRNVLRARLRVVRRPESGP